MLSSVHGKGRISHVPKHTRPLNCSGSSSREWPSSSGIFHILLRIVVYFITSDFILKLCINYKFDKLIGIFKNRKKYENGETGPERERPQKNLQWQPNTDQEMIANKIMKF